MKIRSVTEQKKVHIKPTERVYE